MDGWSKIECIKAFNNRVPAQTWRIFAGVKYAIPISDGVSREAGGNELFAATAKSKINNDKIIRNVKEF